MPVQRSVCRLCCWTLVTGLSLKRVGVIVSPTKETVQSALVEAVDRVTARFLVVDVHNGNLSTSWPLVMFSSITTRQHANASSCTWMTYGQQMLVWTQLNEQATRTIEEQGYVPLPLVYKRCCHHPSHFITLCWVLCFQSVAISCIVPWSCWTGWSWTRLVCCRAMASRCSLPRW
jgi:hypothetical protein